MFITGAGDGIGKQTALLAARKGALIIASDIDEKSVKATVKEINAANPTGGNAEAHRLDVTDRDAYFKLAEKVLAKHSRVDIVMNNAGVALFATADKMTQEELDWVMDINFFGTVTGCNAFLPQMTARGSGHIINISSIFGLISVPSQAGYNASKFAVAGYSDALRQEIKAQGVKVTTVHPGGITTRIAERARVMQMEGMEEHHAQMVKKFAEVTITKPEKAAEIIIRAIEKNKPRIRVGPDAVFVDWARRLFPVLYPHLTNILLKMDK